MGKWAGLRGLVLLVCRMADPEAPPPATPPEAAPPAAPAAPAQPCKHAELRHVCKACGADRHLTLGDVPQKLQDEVSRPFVKQLAKFTVNLAMVMREYKRLVAKLGSLAEDGQNEMDRLDKHIAMTPDATLQDVGGGRPVTLDGKPV